MKEFDKIILFTTHYPYESGEEFIEDEIKYLENACKEVLIFPTEVKDFSATRPVSTSIYVYSKSLFRSKARRLFSFLFALFHREVIHEILSLICQRKFNRITLKRLLSYYETANWKAHKIKETLQRKIKKNDRVLLYAYWLNETAYIVSLLRECYPQSVTVARAHGFDIYLERHPCNYFPLRQTTTKGIDCICTASENGCSYLAEHFPYIKNRLHVSRLGTIDHGLNPSEKKSEFDLQIVSCSSLIPLKRVDLLIDALAQMTKYKIEWTHFGSGPLENELLAQALEKLSGNVTWRFAGHILNAELMKIYQVVHFDIFVHVSETEGGGPAVAIKEALSFGIPVIATNVGGTSEGVINYVNGFLVDPSIKPDELSTIIEKFILLNSDERKSYRLEARKVWETRCNAANNYKEFYEMLMQMPCELY